MTPNLRLRGLLLRGSWVLLWAGVIFYFSHQPGSGAVWEPPLWYILERKSAHVLEFALLTFLVFRFLWLWWRERSFALILSISILVTLLYGVFDEIHQWFVIGREARATDVFIDGLGILMTGVFIAWLYQRHRNFIANS